MTTPPPPSELAGVSTESVVSTEFEHEYTYRRNNFDAKLTHFSAVGILVSAHAPDRGIHSPASKRSDTPSLGGPSGVNTRSAPIRIGFKEAGVRRYLTSEH